MDWKKLGLTPSRTFDAFSDGSVVIDGQRYAAGSPEALRYRSILGPLAPTPEDRTRRTVRVAKIDPDRRTVTYETVETVTYEDNEP